MLSAFLDLKELKTSWAGEITHTLQKILSIYSNDGTNSPHGT